jgi:predicted  nucleic acid-binding Zn-ribbon protein
MLREAKKLRKELRALLEDARTRVAKLETQVLDGKLEIDSLKASPWFLMRLMVLIVFCS